MRSFVGIVALGVLATAYAWAQQAVPATGAVQEQFICQLPGSSDRRLIGIYRAKGQQRCRVDYTRDGRTRSLWSAGHDYQFCVRKAVEIVGLLQNVKYKCTLNSAHP